MPMPTGPAIIKKYFPEISSATYEKFVLLGDLYGFWNERINVISRKDFENIYINHILHSLSIGKLYTFSSRHKILDVGTGGGFPGIPLAILYPNTHFFLVDSIQKKIQVVQEVAKTLKLNNVTAQAVRAEKIGEKYNYVVSRAVTRLNNFMPWIHKIVLWDDEQSGVLYLKGGEIEEEIAEISNYTVKINELSRLFDEPFFETKKLLHIFKK